MSAGATSEPLSSVGIQGDSGQVAAQKPTGFLGKVWHAVTLPFRSVFGAAALIAAGVASVLLMKPEWFRSMREHLKDNPSAQSSIFFAISDVGNMLNGFFSRDKDGNRNWAKFVTGPLGLMSSWHLFLSGSQDDDAIMDKFTGLLEPLKTKAASPEQVADAEIIQWLDRLDKTTEADWKSHGFVERYGRKMGTTLGGAWMAAASVFTFLSGFFARDPNVPIEKGDSLLTRIRKHTNGDVLNSISNAIGFGLLWLSNRELPSQEGKGPLARLYDQVKDKFHYYSAGASFGATITGGAQGYQDLKRGVAEMQSNDASLRETGKQRRDSGIFIMATQAVSAGGDISLARLKAHEDKMERQGTDLQSRMMREMLPLLEGRDEELVTRFMQSVGEWNAAQPGVESPADDNLNRLQKRYHRLLQEEPAEVAA